MVVFGRIPSAVLPPPVLNGANVLLGSSSSSSSSTSIVIVSRRFVAFLSLFIYLRLLGRPFCALTSFDLYLLCTGRHEEPRRTFHRRSLRWQQWPITTSWKKRADTHTREKKKGSKKDRRVFLSFALVIWPRDVTSSTLNQYNRHSPLPTSSLSLSLPHKRVKTEWRSKVDVTDSYGLYHTVSVRRAWWVHKTGNRTLNTYTTVQSFPVYITVGGVGYKEDGLHEDANDRQRKKK